jgi:transposase-like protein
LPRGYARSDPKYSHLQKHKAVEHYFEHGHCIAFTIKALGYPGRDSLRAWIDGLHPDKKTRVVARSASLARPPAMKKAAVIELCTRQGSAQAVAQVLGVCRPTLYN